MAMINDGRPHASSIAARALKLVAVVVIAALAIMGGIYAQWVLGAHRLTVITPGRAYQSAAMAPEEMARVASRLKVQTVFDFRDDRDPGVFEAENAALKRDGIRYVHIPSSTSPAPETVDAFVSAMRSEVAAHRTVLLHCHDGEGRAVFYSAVYRMEFEGWDNERALRATTRLPPALMFLRDLYPGIARLSPKNPKTPLILSFRRQLESDAISPLTVGAHN
jgi:protein-tyrosine phosphatase